MVIFNNIWSKSEREVTLDYLITVVPKVLLLRFLFVGFKILGTFIVCILIGLFNKLSVQSFKPLIVIYRRGSICIMIGVVHKFFGHCLIPLDPC